MSQERWPSHSILLSARNLGRSYGDISALEGFSLDLDSGDGVVLFGHNGSGKTTALDCMAGLLTPTTGHVTVAGADPHTEPEATRARATLAYAADSPVFYRDLTVAEHVELVAVAHGVHGVHGVDDGNTEGLLEKLGLTAHRDKFPHELSAGLRQRAQLACALNRPHRLLLLDEPTLRLDPPGRGLLYDLLVAERAAGTAVLFSTHQPEFAVGLADRALLLSYSRVVAEGALDEVLAGPKAAEAGITPA